MGKIHLFTLASLMLMVSCGPKTTVNKEIIRPIKITTVESQSEIRKEFSGVVEAVDFVKLAFRVSGQIIELPVIEGQKVKKGQLIAAIDTRDLALQYAADKSVYETAAAQLERNERLLARQAVSLQDYEISMSSFQKAKSAYQLSANNMRDSRLLAPFDGSIEKKLAENYQRVSSGVPIVQLVNTANLRIRFTIPDNYLYLLKAKNMNFQVEFDTFKGTVFQAKLEEFLDISTDGTGIPVTITVNDPKFKKDIYAVKPGFTCSIRMEANMGEYLQGATVIPLSALYEDTKNNEKCVWIYADGKVTRRVVKILSPTGISQVFISEGLKPGEKIVVAGVYQLTEGEAVKPI